MIKENRKTNKQTQKNNLGRRKGNPLGFLKLSLTCLSLSFIYPLPCLPVPANGSGRQSKGFRFYLRKKQKTTEEKGWEKQLSGK